MCSELHEEMRSCEFDPCTLFQFLRDYNIIINMIITLTNVKDLPILYIDIIVE